MEKAYAEELVDEFRIHFKMMDFDMEKFIQALESTEMPESYKFHEDINMKSQNLYELGRTHYLTLKRVLRNKNARDHKLSPLKGRFELLGSKLGMYDDCDLTRNVRGQEKLIKMMLESEKQGNPYSLLGMFETHDYEIENNKHTIERPVLVIPDISEEKRKIVYKLEDENTIHEKDPRIYGLTVGF